MDLSPQPPNTTPERNGRRSVRSLGSESLAVRARRVLAYTRGTPKPFFPSGLPATLPSMHSSIFTPFLPFSLPPSLPL